MRTHVTKRVSRNLTSLFVLVALFAATVVPAMAQTKPNGGRASGVTRTSWRARLRQLPRRR